MGQMLHIIQFVTMRRISPILSPFIIQFGPHFYQSLDKPEAQRRLFNDVNRD